ncbi:Tetratricopeptide repeat [Nesidiocoris tenuis]|uniref:Tetratricopeptide repeat n=1 Tax=Nesidiocoris tenuis TaxID=355587 RepID=A0ABN7AWV4_9HEMI|nr:Tetratricopeptide repeat [Nesidiocoris tenuis]
MSEVNEMPSNERIVDDLVRGVTESCTVGDNAELLTSTSQKPGGPVIDGHPSDEQLNRNETTSDNSSPDADDDKHENPDDDTIDEEALKSRECTLSDDDKQRLTKESEELKAGGNDLFKRGLYSESFQKYTLALRTCPLSSPKTRAILFANRAACKIHLGRTSSAIDDCSKAIELDETYVKAYLRRAKAYEETDKLDEALADFTKVLEFDRSNPDALEASMRLPPVIEERNEKLKAEMLSKLKDLGNCVLKPFGLSTNNFQMVQDPNTGGYSINFKS